MLDMGGMPSASNDNSMLRTKNASKNSKLQAVAFDFETLTNSIEEAKGEEQNQTLNDSRNTKVDSKIQPDVGKIQQVASLLNVNIDGSNANSSTQSVRKDDLKKAQPHEDIRAKYARKIHGGLAGVELAKSQVEETLARGDASGHLAARKLAIQTTAASPTKWMAMTGTGVLLSYLTHRSIKIALLPNPKLSETAKKEHQQESMQALKRQLKDVVIDCVVRIKEGDGLEANLQSELLDPLDLHPNSVLIVTDRDDYLKAAKELGMLTCRLQKKNQRRGNITAHFNTPSVPDVQEIVNEINGISFNSVLNR